MKHTPGPWSISKHVDERGDGHITIRGLPTAGFPIGVHICKVNESVEIKLDGANSKLIAAAPDLLEACRWAVEMLPAVDDETVHGARARCRNAIAKAEGR